MDKPIKIAALGDISLNEEIIPDPFEHVRRYLKRFDIVFGNLETVLTKEDKHLVKRTALKSHPDNAKFLRLNNNVVYNIAQNHIRDYYGSGYFDLIQLGHVLKIQEKCDILC